MFLTVGSAEFLTNIFIIQVILYPDREKGQISQKVDKTMPFTVVFLLSIFLNRLLWEKVKLNK